MADKAKIQRSGKAKWTVMVYMAGDNNLDGAALRDIEEMARVGSTKDVNCLVQLDRLEDKKTRRFLITKGGGYERDCLETFGETNTGDPKVLEDFLSWSAQRYPAERYFLILWNHGSGWWEEARSRAAARKTSDARLRCSTSRSSLFYHKTETSNRTTHRSICYDDHSGGDALDNRELKDVLARACTVIGKKIDILGMDACLMTMVEVAWQLRDTVEILVGSEIEEPNDGWPYAEILQFFTTKPKSKTHVVAKEVVKQYVASYRDEGETVTQSAINTAATAEIIWTLNSLAAEILSDFDKNRKLIQWAWEKAPKFYDDNYLDLYAFARKLCSKSKDRERLREKVDALIIALRIGNTKSILCQGKLGREVAGTKGLSIYFPADSINPAYRGLDFANECRWADFLERVLG